MQLRRRVWMKDWTLERERSNTDSDRYAELGYANAKYVGTWMGEGWELEVIAQSVGGGEDESIMLSAKTYDTMGDETGLINWKPSPDFKPIAKLILTKNEVFIHNNKKEVIIIISRAPIELNLEFRDLFKSIVPNWEHDHAWVFFLLEED